MKYRMKFVCSYCGTVNTTETYEFGDSLFLRACFGCDACHMEGKIDDFLMHNAETEIAPQMYYVVVPYGIEEDGTFLFMIGPPNLCNHRMH